MGLRKTCILERLEHQLQALLEHLKLPQCKLSRMRFESCNANCKALIHSPVWQINTSMLAFKTVEVLFNPKCLDLIARAPFYTWSTILNLRAVLGEDSKTSVHLRHTSSPYNPPG